MGHTQSIHINQDQKGREKVGNSDGSGQRGTAAVIVIDDRVASGARANHAGDRAVADLGEFVRVLGCTVVEETTQLVSQALDTALESGVDLVLTVGGTGLRTRSVTPECTAARIGMRVSGLETQILLRGLESTPSAGLSRGIVGIVDCGNRRTLIVNAAGSRGAVADAVAVVGPLIGNITEQL